MRLHPLRAAAAVAVAVASLAPVAPAFADPQKCLYVPIVYVDEQPTAATTKVCVPWPL